MWLQGWSQLKKNGAPSLESEHTVADLAYQGAQSGSHREACRKPQVRQHVEQPAVQLRQHQAEGAASRDSDHVGMLWTCLDKNPTGELVERRIKEHDQGAGGPRGRLRRASERCTTGHTSHIGG